MNDFDQIHVCVGYDSTVRHEVHLTDEFQCAERRGEENLWVTHTFLCLYRIESGVCCVIFMKCLSVIKYFIYLNILALVGDIILFQVSFCRWKRQEISFRVCLWYWLTALCTNIQSSSRLWASEQCQALLVIPRSWERGRDQTLSQSLPMEPALQTPWFWISSFQNYEKINLCGFWFWDM